jgi:hypothetical protein
MGLFFTGETVVLTGVKRGEQAQNVSQRPEQQQTGSQIALQKVDLSKPQGFSILVELAIKTLSDLILNNALESLNGTRPGILGNDQVAFTQESLVQPGPELTVLVVKTGLEKTGSQDLTQEPERAIQGPVLGPDHLTQGYQALEERLLPTLRRNLAPEALLEGLHFGPIPIKAGNNLERGRDPNRGRPLLLDFFNVGTAGL